MRSFGSTGSGCPKARCSAGSAYYNLEGLGIKFVASPRHADLLLVTGPVSRNMEVALKRTWEATPDPKLVVAIGDCGCDGGVFGECYASRGRVSNVIPVDVAVPGCPPTPAAIMQGIRCDICKTRREALLKERNNMLDTFDLDFIGWFYATACGIVILFGLAVFALLYARGIIKERYKDYNILNDVMLLMIWVIGFGGAMGVIDRSQWGQFLLQLFCWMLIALVVLSAASRMYITVHKLGRESQKGLDTDVHQHDPVRAADHSFLQASHHPEPAHRGGTRGFRHS